MLILCQNGTAATPWNVKSETLKFCQNVSFHPSATNSVGIVYIPGLPDRKATELEL